MFLCVKQVNILQRSSVKNKHCKERIIAKVGICMCSLKIKINNIDYSRIMVNNR